jgi:hypothetical protein
MIRAQKNDAANRLRFMMTVLLLAGCSCQRKIPPEFEYSPGYIMQEHPAVTVQSLRGRVTDARGAPIEHVLVERTTSDYKTRMDASLTDSAGRFHFRMMHSNTYYLRFRYRGFDDFLISVQVSPNADKGSLEIPLVVSK